MGGGWGSGRGSGGATGGGGAIAALVAFAALSAVTVEFLKESLLERGFVALGAFFEGGVSREFGTAAAEAYFLAEVILADVFGGRVNGVNAISGRHGGVAADSLLSGGFESIGVKAIGKIGGALLFSVTGGLGSGFGGTGISVGVAGAAAVGELDTRNFAFGRRGCGGRGSGGE